MALFFFCYVTSKPLNRTRFSLFYFNFQHVFSCVFFCFIYEYLFFNFFFLLLFIGIFSPFRFIFVNHKKIPFTWFRCNSFVPFFCYVITFYYTSKNGIFVIHFTFHTLKRFTLSFWLFNHFNRGLMPVHTSTPIMTRHTFTTNHSNNPMISSPLFPRKSLDTAPTVHVPVSPRFTRRPFPNKASPGL